MFGADNNVMAARMLEYRKKAGLTQAEVAERAGISDRTYADIERGYVVNRRLGTLIAICTVLDVTVDTLLMDSSEEEIEMREDELLADIRRRPLPDGEHIINVVEKTLAWLDECMK